MPSSRLTSAGGSTSPRCTTSRVSSTPPPKRPSVNRVFIVRPTMGRFPATNVPFPCTRTRYPSAVRFPSACRMVILLTAYRAASSASLGMRSPISQVPLPISSTSSRIT